MKEYMSEEAAKVLIARFAEKQWDEDYPCPRCGRSVMESDPVRNALSRRLNVYICDECGMTEALEDMPGAPKTPLSAWAIAKEPARWGVRPPKLRLRLVGRDSWNRPVYECEGRLYVDIDPRADRRPDICTKQGNSFGGEPSDPIPDWMEVEFIPRRDTW